MHWNPIINNNRISTISKESKRENPKTTRRVEPNKDRFALCFFRTGKEKKIVKHTQRKK